MTLFGGMAQKCPIISRTFKMGLKKGPKMTPKRAILGQKGSFLALFGPFWICFWRVQVPKVV
jgi:hypothetical protein